MGLSMGSILVHVNCSLGIVCAIVPNTPKIRCILGSSLISTYVISIGPKIFDDHMHLAWNLYKSYFYIQQCRMFNCHHPLDLQTKIHGGSGNT